jgi:hypothetical protein
MIAQEGVVIDVVSRASLGKYARLKGMVHVRLRKGRRTRAKRAVASLGGVMG